MKKKLIILLFFFPLTVLGQDLKCCKSEKEVETFLTGNWRLKGDAINRQNRYQFNEGIDTFEVFDINKNGDLIKIKNNLPTLKILKTATGFQIENDFDVIKTYTGIKYLDSNILIVTRRDGKKNEYYKILE